MRFRATCTVIFDFDTALAYEQAIKTLREEVASAFSARRHDKIKTFVQLDKVRSKADRIRIAEFALDEFFSGISETKSKKQYIAGGKKYLVRMNQDRYLLFRSNRRCVSCGLEGTRVFLECQHGEEAAHFNLYGELDDKLVLMTKDHIQAKACGGEDKLENYQTMCSTCNSLKAHSNLSVDDTRKLRDLHEENKNSVPRRKLHQIIDSARNSMERPWPGAIIKSGGLRPANSCVVNDDLFVRRVEDDLVASPGGSESGSVAKIECGAYLVILLEVNDECCCEMPDGSSVRIKKLFLADK